MGLPLPIKESQFVFRIDILQKRMKKMKFTSKRGYARELIALALGFKSADDLHSYLKSRLVPGEPFRVPTELEQKLAVIEFGIADLRSYRPDIIPVKKPKKPKVAPIKVSKKPKSNPKKPDKKPTAAKKPTPVIVYKKVLGGLEHGA